MLSEILQEVEDVKEEKSTRNKVDFKRIHRRGASLIEEFKAMQRLELENKLRDFRTKKSYSKQTREDILRYLQNPAGYVKQLREASIYLYYSNIHYWRLIQYFARLSPLAYYLVPVKFQQDKADIKKYQAAYKKATEYLTTMNFKHEMQKVLTVVFREDVFYGYMYILKDSFYLRRLDPEYCKITGCEDGCFIYSFDFSYFNGHEDELEYYGNDFISRFNAYKADTTNMRWQELPSENEFCIKLQEEVLYPIVPFSSTFDDLFELKDYKTLQKAKTEIQNYKILGLKLPTDEDGVVLHQTEEIDDYYNSLTNVLPSNIGAFVTPYDVKEYSFDRANAGDTDLVDEATNNFMNSTGVSKLLFNSKNATSSSLPYSIESDATIVYGLHRQIERNINRLLKQLGGTQKFAIKIIDCTYYTIDDAIDRFMKQGQYGFPVRLQVSALSGTSNNEMQGMCYMEKEVLGLTEQAVPLVSSTNASSDLLMENKTGRPQSEQPSDKTITNQQTQ